MKVLVDQDPLFLAGVLSDVLAERRPHLFEHAGLLHAYHPGVGLRRLEPELVNVELGSLVEPYTYDANGNEKRAKIPRDVIVAVERCYVRGRFRQAKGVSRRFAVRHGRLLSGYDPVSQIIYEPPEVATPKKSLRQYLDELLVGYTPEARRLWYAFALGIAQRTEYDIAPGLLVGAAAQGAGKTTYVQTLAAALGDAPVAHAADIARTDEVYKELIQGPAVYLLDNQTKPLSIHKWLPGYVTSPSVQIRVSYGREPVDFPTHPLVAVTANTPEVDQDAAERFITVWLPPGQYRLEPGARTPLDKVRDAAAEVRGAIIEALPPPTWQSPYLCTTRFPAWERCSLHWERHGVEGAHPIVLHQPRNVEAESLQIALSWFEKALEDGGVSSRDMLRETDRNEALRGAVAYLAKVDERRLGAVACGRVLANLADRLGAERRVRDGTWEYVA